MLLAGVTIFALGVLTYMETKSAMMHVHESSFLMPTSGRRLSNMTAEGMPRQLQGDVQMSDMGGLGGLGSLVDFFANNIMLLWLLVLILGCCGCHTLAHYMSIALYGLSYIELCFGRRPMMGMGGLPMGGIGGNPMGGMNGYPMEGGGMGGYPMANMGGGYPMAGMGSGNGHMGNGGYHGGFNAQPVHHASFAPAGRQPDGSWKF